MPGRDRTGPAGRGRQGQKGPGRRGQGTGGYCICPKCSYKSEHTAGTPCSSTVCPKCGTPMIRGS